jgi:hypothetical protein
MFVTLEMGSKYPHRSGGFLVDLCDHSAHASVSRGLFSNRADILLAMEHATLPLFPTLRLYVNSTSISNSPPMSYMLHHSPTVILADSIRNYMSKFLSDAWMYENGFVDEKVTANSPIGPSWILRMLQLDYCNKI